ncbi:MAG: helix-turn-helix domain-containing protein [Cytophagaceae bacterium]
MKNSTRDNIKPEVNINLFTYKAGFYELPYNINSPQEMIEGFKKIPSIKSNPVKNSITTTTPFLNVTVHYRQVEPELFLIYSEVIFKSNVCFRHYYDKSKSSNYYCLSLRIDKYSKINNSLVNGNSYTDNSWLIFKPGAKVNHYHFKGTKGKYFSVYFTHRWMKEHFKQIPKNDQNVLNLFFRSTSDHLICPNSNEETVYKTEELRKIILSGESIGKAHLTKLKKQIQNFISYFILKMRSEKINERHFLISNPERMQILKAEKILEKHIYKKFPGIQFLAKEIGLSGTKLKECFKTVYNNTPFQYFRSLQMEQAIELLSNTNMPIGQIARKLGYENASKFAFAFKAHHNFLPSKVQRKKS